MKIYGKENHAYWRYGLEKEKEKEKEKKYIYIYIYFGETGWIKIICKCKENLHEKEKENTL